MPQPTADPPLSPPAMTPERLDELEQIAEHGLRNLVDNPLPGLFMETVVEIRRAWAELHDSEISHTVTLDRFEERAVALEKAAGIL